MDVEESSIDQKKKKKGEDYVSLPSPTVLFLRLPPQSHGPHVILKTRGEHLTQAELMNLLLQSAGFKTPRFTVSS